MRFSKDLSKCFFDQISKVESNVCTFFTTADDLDEPPHPRLVGIVCAPQHDRLYPES